MTTFFKAIHQAGEVSVHGVDLRPDDAVEAACQALLDPEERSRADRFKVAAPRRRFVVTRGALRLLLAARIGRPAEALAFGAGPHGKPFLITDGEPSAISFNVSHSAEHALVAIACSPVGVDVEWPERQGDLALVAKGVFTEVERAALDARSGTAWIALFFRLWTVKEALIKGRGCGFAYPPARFEVPALLRAGAAGATFTFPGEISPVWHITDLSREGYVAALALAGSA